ncbi:MAG: response regulator [Victivallales bacterium]
MGTNRILIVDDKEENNYLLRALLQGNGYEVEVASNGSDALLKARKNPPDLIISDILMPVMDGFALCREWRKDERLESIPFVFYTATYTDERDEKFALGIGADRFIVKPQEPDVFMEIIRKTARQSANQSTAQAKPPEADESVYLKQYNETLIRKLENKMEQLEKTNRQLEEDIAERRQTDEERERLQAQLVQSQKMESIGRLAGGVAHDFNNMLTAILGHTEMAMDKLGTKQQALLEDLQEIKKAAEHSADLTRQLLAFARKQTITPKVFELNDAVERMLKILRRLIGEDISLDWKPGKNLWPVKMDTSQLNQILTNLCVNARDAISGLGNLTIGTENAVFDESYCVTHEDAITGEYVQLTVSDTGCGMDKETLGIIFEPFFTTKEIGKGTGMGLPTVYGIVKQNNGFISVDSEHGKGSIFKIYLPRHMGKIEQLKANGTPPAPVTRGHETILLVEDEQTILNITKTILEGFGYRVLAAKTPGEAMRLAEEHAGEIHLLLTDVVMPEMNGRNLSKKLISLYPDLKSIFMSGYTANVIASHGIIDDGVHFIQKPFTIKYLSEKVRAALNSQ